jgi:hypothetical protein
LRYKALSSSPRTEKKKKTPPTKLFYFSKTYMSLCATRMFIAANKYLLTYSTNVSRACTICQAKEDTILVLKGLTFQLHSFSSSLTLKCT